MSNVQPMAPRKVMTRLEREFLKVAGQELAQVKVGGAAALAVIRGGGRRCRRGGGLQRGNGGAARARGAGSILIRMLAL